MNKINTTITPINRDNELAQKYYEREKLTRSTGRSNSHLLLEVTSISLYPFCLFLSPLKIPM